MEYIMYQVDAFADRVFEGNPAAVIPLESWPDDELLLKIAMENNLSETAYFVQQDDHYHLRWFTPEVEVELCGHATLASAFVLFEILGFSGEQIHFETMSGPLYVKRSGDQLEMDFPVTSYKPADDYYSLSEGLGLPPLEVYEAGTKYMAVYEKESEVAGLNPDFNKLKALTKNVIVTAPGDQHDFISRFFAPPAGINEDPVTGSAHTMLTPYWAGRLDKQELSARQISKRGGDIGCVLRGERVILRGNAVLYLTGRIEC